MPVVPVRNQPEDNGSFKAVGVPIVKLRDAKS